MEIRGTPLTTSNPEASPLARAARGHRADINRQSVLVRHEPKVEPVALAAGRVLVMVSAKQNDSVRDARLNCGKPC